MRRLATFLVFGLLLSACSTTGNAANTSKRRVAKKVTTTRRGIPIKGAVPSRPVASKPVPTVVTIVPVEQAAAARAAAPWADYGTIRFTLTQVDGSEKEFCALLADTPAAQARGLMQRTDLGGYDAMLFTWDNDTSGGFWMRTVPIWLSIAWFDKVGSLVTKLDMAPCGDREDCPNYVPTGPYRVAMETLRGGLEPLGVSKTSRLLIGGACRTLPKSA